MIDSLSQLERANKEGHVHRLTWPAQLFFPSLLFSALKKKREEQSYLVSLLEFSEAKLELKLQLGA